jgi:hypothetical protein
VEDRRKKECTVLLIISRKEAGVRTGGRRNVLNCWLLGEQRLV